MHKSCICVCISLSVYLFLPIFISPNPFSLSVLFCWLNLPFSFLHSSYVFLSVSLSLQVPPQMGQMGQMGGVPVMAPQPMMYNQPVLRPTNPFTPMPGAQVSCLVLLALTGSVRSSKHLSRYVLLISYPVNCKFLAGIASKMITIKKASLFFSLFRCSLCNPVRGGSRVPKATNKQQKKTTLKRNVQTDRRMT